MSTSVVAALVTAGVLGVTHALEPDHVAGISSLTSEFGDSRLSALVGGCFAVGHVALVVAWLAVASLVVGSAGFPPVLDAVGTAGVALLLGLFGSVMAVGGLRRLLRGDEHRHGDHTHSHPHLHLPLPGFDAHEHAHDTAAYLKTGVVGALFTLSPPLSMLAFASTLLPDLGPAGVAVAVGSYAVGITATMSVLGAGAGALFGLTRARGHRVHGAARVAAGVAVVALAASLGLGSVPV